MCASICEPELYPQFQDNLLCIDVLLAVTNLMLNGYVYVIKRLSLRLDKWMHLNLHTEKDTI